MRSGLPSFRATAPCGIMRCMSSFADAVPIPSELVALLLGFAAWGFLTWLRSQIEAFTTRHARTEEKIEHVEAAEQDFTIKLTEGIATIFQELKDHHRRIGDVEVARDADRRALEQIERTVAVHNEKARIAIADVSTLNAEVRRLSDAMVRFETLLQAHDGRVRESNAKVDRVMDLFMRGTAAAARV